MVLDIKWVDSVTAETAAVVAVGLEQFHSLQKVKQQIILEIDANELQKLQVKYNDAKVICEALQEAIELVDPDLSPPNDGALPVLFISKIVRLRGSEDFGLGGALAPEKCKVTKTSLAEWFWARDKEVAKKFDGNIEYRMMSTPTLHSSMSKMESKKKPATKSVNYQLKTIAALSDALIGGLTDKKHKDAEAILVALAEKGIESPVGSRALAKYLGQAKEL